MEIKAMVKNRLYPVTYGMEGEKIRITIEDRDYLVDAVSPADGFFSLLINGRCYDAAIEAGDNSYTVLVEGRTGQVDFHDPRDRRPTDDLKRSIQEGRQSIHAPMAGQLIRLLVQPGDLVEDGQGLVVLEAMKMENELKSQGVGKVKKIFVTTGDVVEPGQELLIIE